jgi:hypothetical protein
MKQTVYKITLSNGQKIDMPAQSAGEAIEQALIKNRGLTVARCYAGLTEEDAAFIRQTCDKRAIAGFIDHEIPEHEAIGEHEVFTRPKRVDNTTAMFDDAAIADESKMAKSKFTNYRIVGSQPL